jgi:hypothetical protein
LKPIQSVRCIGLQCYFQRQPSRRKLMCLGAGGYAAHQLGCMCYLHLFSLSSSRMRVHQSCLPASSIERRRRGRSCQRVAGGFGSRRLNHITQDPLVLAACCCGPQRLMSSAGCQDMPSVTGQRPWGNVKLAPGSGEIHWTSFSR